MTLMLIKFCWVAKILGKLFYKHFTSLNLIFLKSKPPQLEVTDLDRYTKAIIVSFI